MNWLKLSLLCFVCLSIYACQTDKIINTSNLINCNTSNTMRDTVVLLVLGQSNAANYGDSKYTAICSNTENFYGGIHYPLADPLKGADGIGGSVWSRLGDKMMQQNFASKVIIAPCAVGGTRIEQWIPGGNLNYLLVKTIQDLQQANLQVTHVLWHQGEGNHVNYSTGLSPEINAANYAVNFDMLVSFLRNMGIQAPVYAAIATQCQSNSDAALQQAQYNLQNQVKGIYNGPNTDSLGSNYRYDNCHFNAEGLDKHADLWLSILMK